MKCFNLIIILLLSFLKLLLIPCSWLLSVGSNAGYEDKRNTKTPQIGDLSAFLFDHVFDIICLIWFCKSELILHIHKKKPDSF